MRLSSCPATVGGAGGPVTHTARFTNHDLPGGGGLAAEWNPVALYVKEIGAINLLDARQEVEIGRRIEGCRAVLRRTLAAILEYIDALLEVANRVGSGHIALWDIVLVPGRRILTAAEQRGIVRTFSRLRALRPRRLASRRTRQLIHKEVEALPLRPELLNVLFMIGPQGRVRGTNSTILKYGAAGENHRRELGGDPPRENGCKLIE